MFFFLFFLELSVLEDNKDLESILSEFQMPTMKYGTFKIAGFGETMFQTFSFKWLNTYTTGQKF